MMPPVRALAVLALLLLFASADAKKLKSVVTRDHMKVRTRSSLANGTACTLRFFTEAAEVVPVVLAAGSLSPSAHLPAGVDR